MSVRPKKIYGKKIRGKYLLSEEDRQAVRNAISSLEELVPDPECDFGPAYAFMESRQKEAIKGLIALLNKPEVSVPQSTPRRREMFSDTCGYSSFEGSICSKCGEVHTLASFPRFHDRVNVK